MKANRVLAILLLVVAVILFGDWLSDSNRDEKTPIGLQSIVSDLNSSDVRTRASAQNELRNLGRDALAVHFYQYTSIAGGVLAQQDSNAIPILENHIQELTANHDYSDWDQQEDGH